MAVTKIKPIRATIEKSLDYIMRSDKTENCLYFSSENCVPETAAIEFEFILDKARSGGNTIGRHLIQSFSPDDNVTPEQAHEIGKKLAAEILGGQYAYVLATHVDREHIHNHYVWCAVNMETHKKYISNKATYHKIQDVSDKLCAEYSLSVITEKSGRRGKSYTEYQADKQGASWKTLLRKTIDAAIRSSDTFDAFLSFMKESGYEIKSDITYLSFRAAGQERYTRAKTVGDNYTEDRIRERIAAPKTTPMPTWIKPSVEKIIDRTDEKIRSSPAYSHWASKHNLQAMVDTHNYLSRNFAFDLAEFEQRYNDCMNRRSGAKSAFDQAAKQIAADKSIGVGERLAQHNALKIRHDKEMTALNTELAELNRIRENVADIIGEKSYQKISKKGTEVAL